MLDGEKNLVIRAQKGEAEAFGLLYNHYLPQIYRFVYLKVSHREEAEDLTHQVFVKAWQNLKNYEERGFPFSSWLYQISRNQVIDHYRQKRPTIDIETADMEIPTDVPRNASTDFKFEVKRIQESLKKLTPVQQDVVVMHFINDMSIKDIAKTMNKTEGAIRLLQHRAIGRLKKILKPK